MYTTVNTNKAKNTNYIQVNNSPVSFVIDEVAFRIRRIHSHWLMNTLVRSLKTVARTVYNLLCP